MKKLFFALLLAAVALTGCDKDETTDVVLRDVELKASIDLNASRVAFDEGGNFFWTVNDAIGVTTKTSKSRFAKMTMKTGGEGQATATFKGTLSGKPEGYAVYPYNKEHALNGSELTYNFPTSYNYTIQDHSYFVTDGQGNSFNPAMWATIEDGRVHFKHLGGVFCIKIADMPAGANQTLTVTTSQRITGDFTADLAANPVLVTDNEAGNVVTINFSNDEESDRVFYVPVPTGLYELICVAYEADGELVEVYYENREVKPKNLVQMEIGEFELEGGEAEQAAKQKKALEEVCAAGVGEIKLTSDVTFDQILTIADPQAVTRAAEAATITIDGNGHKLISKAERAINVATTANVVIKNLTVECSGERGVNVIQKPANVTLEQVTMTAANYTVNAAGSGAGATIAIKNSTLTGLNVVNIAAPNANVTVENTTLNCVDENETAGENYAALAMNKDAVNGVIAATNCTFNIGGDSFKAKNDAEGAVITIDGKTDEVRVDVAMIGYGGNYYYAFQSLADAIEFAKAGETVKLIRDITASEIVVVNKAITIDGDGHKLTSTAGRAINVETEGNVVIKNLTVECSGERAVNVINKPANVTLENVTMKAANYTVNAAGSGAGATIAIKNSTLTGLNVVNIAAKNAVVTVENTALNCEDKTDTEGYAALALYHTAVDATITATGCTFNISGDSFKGSVGSVGGKITIDGTTDGVEQGVAYIEYPGEVAYVFFKLEEAIETAKAGETITLLRDITASEIVVVDKAISIDGNGRKLTSTAARAINVQAEGNVVIKNLTVECSGERGVNVIQKPANVTLENVTMKAANYTVNAAGSGAGATIAIKNSTLTGLNVVNIAAPNANVTVENTTLNCVDENETAGENYAALAMNKDAVNGVIAATNCTFNIGGDSFKAKNDAEGAVITIDGKTDEVRVDVAMIGYGGNYYYAFQSLADAIEFAKAGETVKLIRDIELNAPVKVTKDVTLNLNGKTVNTGVWEEEGYGRNSYAFWVKGGTLTINGDGKVIAGDARYSMAVWADGGNVVINGGVYEQLSWGDLIYASVGVVTINGGTFIPSNKNYDPTDGTKNEFCALNCTDANFTNGKTNIVVKGGKFFKFDPANNMSETGHPSFLAEGYTSTQEGDYYVVK